MNKSQYSKFNATPAPFPDKPAKTQNLFMENEPNSNESDVAVTNANRKTYNDFLPENPKRNEPKRTQLKPIKANPKPMAATTNTIADLPDGRIIMKIGDE